MWTILPLFEHFSAFLWLSTLQLVYILFCQGMRNLCFQELSNDFYLKF
jgi:hypothetical protein